MLTIGFQFLFPPIPSDEETNLPCQETNFFTKVAGCRTVHPWVPQRVQVINTPATIYRTCSLSAKATNRDENSDHGSSFARIDQHCQLIFPRSAGWLVSLEHAPRFSQILNPATRDRLARWTRVDNRWPLIEGKRCLEKFGERGKREIFYRIFQTTRSSATMHLNFVIIFSNNETTTKRRNSFPAL